mmetsp:Transcript_6223/g.5564  ORF Transcript_6223/g.5564 Transcript_6223/m.5564 type:complete len:84 (+) Transcript_6223:20-271(+)
MSMRTNFSRWRKSKFWSSALFREGFKFSLYLSLPILASVVYANPEVMRELLIKLELVKYPKAAEIPDINDIERIKKQINDRKQ